MFCLKTNFVYAQKQSKNPQPTWQLFQDSVLLTPNNIHTTLKLQHTNLVPFSDTLWVNGFRLSSDNYNLDAFTGTVKLDSLYIQSLRLGSADSSSYGLVVRYKAFSSGLPTVFGLRSQQTSSGTKGNKRTKPDVLDSLFFYEPYDEVPKTAQIYDKAKLVTRGNWSRAVTNGTGQDPAINSEFRLNVEGELGDDWQVLATITDENLPIQPGGTTAQLTDFDRFYIQLKKQDVKLTAGDLEITRSDSRFGNIYRNVLGAGVSYNPPGRQFSFAGAAAKGRFHTLSFQGENAKQGPYRLSGKDGERFIIILAGSERVYLNGKALQRGIDRDYIMDYNTGELTFTPNQPITINTRIVVDFEYVNRSYNRTLVWATVADSLLSKRFSFNFQYGREADNANAPLDAPLDSIDLKTLRQAGDNPALAFRTGITPTAFNPNERLYRLQDTTVNGKKDSVYVYSPTQSEGQQYYRMNFAFVGAGKGNYSRAPTLVNGNIFVWRAPDANGNPTGDYMPIRVLTLPRSLQNANLRTEYRFTNRLILQTETAFSAEDKNRLSSLDDQDNTDIATHLALKLQDQPINKAIKLGGVIDAQYVGARFQSFDRVYEKEYGRQWNYNDLGARGIERVLNISPELTIQNQYRLRPSYGLRAQSDSLVTHKIGLLLNSTDTAWIQGNHEVVWIRTDNSPLQNRSDWFRQNGDMYWGRKTKTEKELRIGTEIWTESRMNRSLAQDSLMAGSFAFTDLKPYFRLQIPAKFQIDLSYNYRLDKEAAPTLVDKSRTQTSLAKIQYSPLKGLSFQQTAAYVQFRPIAEVFKTQGLTPNNNLMTHLQTVYTAPSRIIESRLVYRIVSESAARRELTYLKVTPGLGQYVWIDYNQDGVEQLNEFEIAANPLTADYVRLQMLTTQLFPAIGLDFNGSLRVDFQNLKEQEQWWQRSLRTLTTVTNLQLEEKKNSQNNRLNNYILFMPTQDTGLMSQNRRFRQELYIWRANPKGELNFSYAKNNSIQMLFGLDEVRKTQTWAARQRLSLSSTQSRTLENAIQWGTNQYNGLPERNFAIQFRSIAPAFIMQFTTQLRLTLGYELKYKSSENTIIADAPTNAANLTTHRFNAEFRGNKAGKYGVSLRLEGLENTLKGNPNFNTRYELLEGLAIGKNVLVNIVLSRFLSRNLELNIIYDGRFANERAAQHTTRIRINALF